MTVKTFTTRILVFLAILLIGPVAPGFAQKFDNVRDVLKEGFKPQSLPYTTDWGSILSFVLPAKERLQSRRLLRNGQISTNEGKGPAPFDLLDQFGFKNYLMSKNDTQACRFLIEMDLSSSCPPLEIILVNPENITEFIIISKEIKAGHISENYVEKTLLPELIKGRQEKIGDETDNGVTTKTAMIEPPAFATQYANPRISYRTQLVVDDGNRAVRYFDQSVYVLTRHGYIGINIFNTKFLDNKQIDEIIDRIIWVKSPNQYAEASMFDFNRTDIKAEDFVIFE